MPFDDVESVSVASEGGFVVRVGSGDARRLVFIPQPYNAWFDRGIEGRRQLDLPRVARVATRLAVRGLLTALGRSPSRAWSFYGTPVDITASELLNIPAGYDGRAVRTRGRFTNVRASNRLRYSLDAAGAVIGLSPTPETRALVDANAAALDGTEITVTGVFRRQPASPDEPGDEAPSYAISFWDVSSAVLAETSRPAQALTSLFAATPVPMNQPVEVVGQFRGSNLFGDLPPTTRSGAGLNDWVLREGAAAIWVTGAKPEGSGWSLNPLNRRDTSTWLWVSGQLEEQAGRYYLASDGANRRCSDGTAGRRQRSAGGWTARSRSVSEYRRSGGIEPTRPRGGKGAPAGGTVGGKDGQHTEVGGPGSATTLVYPTGRR